MLKGGFFTEGNEGNEDSELTQRRRDTKAWVADFYRGGGNATHQWAPPSKHDMKKRRAIGASTEYAWFGLCNYPVYQFVDTGR
jgi:hypothetical protein